MLLAVKSNNSVVNSQQDFYVVVALPGVSTAATPDSVIDLPRQRVEGPGNIQLWLCIGDQETEAKEVSEKHEIMKAANVYI